MNNRPAACSILLYYKQICVASDDAVHILSSMSKVFEVRTCSEECMSSGIRNELIIRDDLRYCSFHANDLSVGEIAQSSEERVPGGLGLSI